MLQVFDDKPYVSICYLGNEIPKRFTNQSENASITINLPPDWYEINFIGFALRAIIAFEKCDFEYESIGLECDIYSKTNCEKNDAISCRFGDIWQSNMRNELMCSFGIDVRTTIATLMQ